jgi:hypothetical protein
VKVPVHETGEFVLSLFGDDESGSDSAQVVQRMLDLGDVGPVEPQERLIQK